MHPNLSLLATKLESFVHLSAPELEGLAQLMLPPIHVPRGKEIIRQGERDQVAYVLQTGWGCSSKLLKDGGRQIITFPIPGDCIGLRSILLRTSDHSFSALTDAIISPIEISSMLRVFVDFPHVGEAILWATSRDEAITVEHLASVGRRTAIERTAHFFLELGARLRLVGLATDSAFDCPLSQPILADALGLSSIHVNRVLRELRDAKLLTFHDHRVTIHNRNELMALAGYEDVEGAILIRET